MKQLAIYGKGGIGKSTIATNISVFYAEMGLRTLIIGCDPKCDTHITLIGKKKIYPVLELLKKKNEISEKDRDKIIVNGYLGVKCSEIGGPEPGVGCAGRGILVGLDILKKFGIFDQFDVILYDVPGDVVCGGFAKPISKDYAREVYIVTSHEYLSLYAGNNISNMLYNLKVPLGGIIANSRDGNLKQEILRDFTSSIGSKIISIIPWSEIIQECVKVHKSILEYAPESEITDVFRQLAKLILKNKNLSIPNPSDVKNLDI